ncbi:MAG: SDR family oxidoreductase [Acidobacteria bacterium]|nr:SDR family oxidoreductase [Acidobacteriota bacterium]
MNILVTGASGYIGRQLAERLLADGHDVTCMVRGAVRANLGNAERSRIVEADVLRPETLTAVLDGVEVAYYLIHSMSGREHGFEERDRRAAYNFSVAAKRAGVRRVIYLGGLAAAGAPVSEHLKSRHETGAVLRKFGPPLIEFRAGIIVGNGSTSFEIIRCLTERLPVMIYPRWVTTRTQPIAVGDVLDYLIAGLQITGCIEQPVEVGGATVETFRSMMLGYAHRRGLKRWLIRVPVLTPRLSSYWLDLVTPFSPAVTRPLIEGMRTKSVCTTTLAAHLFPTIQPMSYDAALRKCLERSAPYLPLSKTAAAHQAVCEQGIICEIRSSTVNASAERIFCLIADIGGRNGWFYANFLWRLRGWFDRLIGGIGMSRGRSRAIGLQAGDVIDFWRVERVEASRSVLLRAEMKVPGQAWLEFVVMPEERCRATLECRAWFEPRGLLGEIYWWGLYPIHLLVFRGMVRSIRHQAERGWWSFTATARQAFTVTTR